MEFDFDSYCLPDDLLAQIDNAAQARPPQTTEPPPQAHLHESPPHHQQTTATTRRVDLPHPTLSSPPPHAQRGETQQVTMLLGEVEVLRARLEHADQQVALAARRESEAKDAYDVQRVAAEAAHAEALRQMRSDSDFKDQEIRALASTVRKLGGGAMQGELMPGGAMPPPRAADAPALQTPVRRPLAPSVTATLTAQPLFNSCNSAASKCRKRPSSACSTGSLPSSQGPPVPPPLPLPPPQLCDISPTRRVGAVAAGGALVVTSEAGAPFDAERRVSSTETSLALAPAAAASVHSRLVAAAVAEPSHLDAAYGQMLLARVMSEDGELGELLQLCGSDRHGDLPRTLSADLLHASQLLLGGDAYAPLLLHAIEPFLGAESWRAVLAPRAPVAVARTTIVAIRLARLLLSESAACTRAAAAGLSDAPEPMSGAIAEPISDAEPEQHVCAVGSQLLQLVAALADRPTGPATDLLLPALQGLAHLAWAEPLAVCPRLRAWVTAAPSALATADADADGSTNGVAEPSVERFQQPSHLVIESLLAPGALIGVRLEAATLLQHMVEDADTFGELSSAPTQAAAADARPPLALLRLAACLSIANEPRVEADATLNARRLARAALGVFSRAVASHEWAVARLLSPALGLALPQRLISLLQVALHELPAHEGPTESDGVALVQESLLLLLELARTADLLQELAGASWVTDLVGVTSRLTRADMHPALQQLSLPAKMLQNAVSAQG